MQSIMQKKQLLNSEGNCDTVNSFFSCIPEKRIQLMQGGNLYFCPFASYYSLFNMYFSKDLQGSIKDRINIYTETNAEKILEFLAKPAPMCRYCSVSKREFNLEWDKSKKEITEWI